MAFTNPENMNTTAKTKRQTVVMTLIAICCFPVSMNWHKVTYFSAYAINKKAEKNTFSAFILFLGLAYEHFNT
jgi:hypothetical protein